MVLGIIALLTTFIVGLFSDARFLTSVSRSLIGAVAAGLGAYLILLLLECKGIAYFDKLPPELSAEEETPAAQDVPEEAEVSDTDSEAADIEAPYEPNEEESDFQPLAADSLIRMTSPPEQA